VFSEIGKFLPKNAILVLNETKVVPAKLQLTRITGGVATVLVLGIHNGCLRVLCNRRLHTDEHLSLNEQYQFILGQSEGKERLLRPQFPIDQLSTILDQFGSMPLPPYIKHSPLSDEELKREYQTVFAKDAGSIAAPTASLHFTTELLDQLEQSGIQIARVTLHVHLGTFAPLREEQWKEGRLHREKYHMPDETVVILNNAKKEGRPIVAVGTTVVRTLESSTNENGVIVRPNGETSLFIQESYRFHMVDGLITNFHVPRSSLLMLVAAFTGRETLMDLYREAIDQKMRFYSFGDAMMVV
jgi:S-adenosylmethionine:tRNA ribosyltransferase-isomerase